MEEEFGFSLHCPFTLSVIGPTFSGKTEFVFELIHRRHEITTDRLEHVVFVYGIMQDRFIQFGKTHPAVVFTNKLDQVPKLANKDSLVIFDDLMLDFEGKDKNSLITEWFVRGAHHNRVSVILILQNVFVKSRRTCSINSMYKAIFHQIADKTTIINIAKQFGPGKTEYLADAYQKAVQTRFRPLILDFHQFSNNLIRVRSSLFPEDCEVYLPA